MLIVGESTLSHLEKPRRGKVRDIYDLKDQLLFVTTDRISAFDYVLEQIVPFKGIILNQIAEYWFKKTEHIIPNHIISSSVWDYPQEVTGGDQEAIGQLAYRSILARKAKRIDIECVVRGYLVGSGFAEYKRDGRVCGLSLPEGLREADRLAEPIFTPAYKRDDGHDENISFEKMKEIVGNDLAEQLRKVSLELYQYATGEVDKRGLILADTKFEFGFIDDKLILIDEIFTPDSSRYWSAKDYVPGKSPASFDKQFVRDYLGQTGWDKNSAPPPLPVHIVASTLSKYIEAYERVTDCSFSGIFA